MKLNIVIPALNEEQSIRSIIERTLSAKEHIIANSQVTEVEITVVSDGSTDSTVEKANEYLDRINVIVFPKNRGYGAAIMEGWSRSDAGLLAFLDADGTCEPRFFADLCRALVERKVDVILGCRLNTESKMPPIRRIGNFIFATILSNLSSKSVRDTASGMRVVRRESLRHLYPLPTGLHFTPAMSSRAMLSDCVAISEIDMPYSEREGRSKLSVIKDGVRFLNVILSTALLYRPGKLLTLVSWFFLSLAVILMINPFLFFLNRYQLEEWMIYRFLFSSLLFHVSALLWGASAISTRAVEISIQEEIQPASRPLFAWVHTPLVWVLVCFLFTSAIFLVLPGAISLFETGHTEMHWSRFVIALAALHSIFLILVFRGLDQLLDLVASRVKYLEK